MLNFIGNLLLPLKAVWGYIAAGLGAITLIFLYGRQKKAQGRAEKESEDRKAIVNAVNRKRSNERAIRADPDRERVRDQRDKLRGILRSSRSDSSE